MFCIQVHVEFNADKDVIVVEGPPGEVETARDQLEAFTKQLVSFMEDIVFILFLTLVTKQCT